MGNVDFLIIGQGLAGSAVAMRALNRGYRIQVLDEPLENRSSQVAAGLFNPITGRKMVKTWLADEIFPALHEFYPQVEQLTGERFFYPTPVYRPFVSIEEQNEWMGKSSDKSHRSYIGQLATSHAFGDQVNDDFGGITVKQSGYLDTRSYLASVRRFLLERAAFEQCTFDAVKLEIGLDGVRYENLKAKKIIFCQGVANSSNPWFKAVPVKALKGEFLTVQSEWKNDVILNRGVYMVPGPNQVEWRVGATYNRNDHEPGITAWARNELTLKLMDLIRIPYDITGQQWGLRPTTPDRRPILGVHPNHKSLIIFNGLGTKGVSLAPYFSEVLFRWLENRGPLNLEAEVTRFI